MIKFEVEAGKFVEHKLTNKPCGCVDSDHARDVRTRKSVTYVKMFINGVLVHWIMQKQTCIAAHSTDAEVRAYFNSFPVNCLGEFKQARTRKTRKSIFTFNLFD